jgi:ABC-type sugar transport system ATPase subunit
MTAAGSATETASYAARGVSKRYGGVEALTRVDFEIHPGQVQAIVGENGAGKSTLVKILAGAESPDIGSVYIDDRPVRLRSVADGHRAGIAMVFQELSLYPDIDVLGNLFMLHEPTRLGIIDRGKMRDRARVVMDELGLTVPMNAPVGGLRIGERQLLEICRALLTDSRVLILDEPNSALNASESERLFRVIRRLRARGVAVLYVSHRLEDVLRIADVITVMRNGAVVRKLPTESASVGGIVVDMLGQRLPTPLSKPERRVPKSSGTPLRIRSVGIFGELEGINLDVWPGEVVGLAGLEGSGVRALLDVLFGVRRSDAGTVTLPNGRPAPTSIKAAVNAGIARIPADRRRFGASLQQSVAENLVQVTAGVLGEYGFLLRGSTMSRAAQLQVDLLKIGVRGLSMSVGRLSGGNQQKVVLGKWLAARPGIVILDDPTRGIDVGAKRDFYRIIRAIADEGRIVVFTSSELPEFGILCDSVGVFYRGRMVGMFSGDVDQHQLLEAINTGQLE